MATINASFDTKTKTLTVEVDGKSIANVEDFSVYKSCECGDDGAEKFYMSIGQRVRDKDNDMSTWTRLVASETNPEIHDEKEDDRGKALASLSTDTQREIAAFFGA